MRNMAVNVSLLAETAIACFLIYTPYVQEVKDARVLCFRPSDSRVSSLSVSDSRDSFARRLFQVVGTTSLRLLFWLPSMPFAGLSCGSVC
jgi:hypothetical protein